MAQLFSAKLIINQKIQKKFHVLYRSTGQVGHWQRFNRISPSRFYYAENIYILLISIKICNNYY